jgi:hypothetical protein
MRHKNRRLRHTQNLRRIASLDGDKSRLTLKQRQRVNLLRQRGMRRSEAEHYARHNIGLKIPKMPRAPEVADLPPTAVPRKDIQHVDLAVSPKKKGMVAKAAAGVKNLVTGNRSRGG